MIKEYIGDGVYALFDGYGIELRANDFDSPTDMIYIEPSVFEALVRFNQRCKEQKIKEVNDASNDQPVES